ncbi:hypothetical protein M1466_01625 [Candidatus Dependentiae bacterium]|nr:hypothetical protein [Candidatus Dependentiae bacterium]
MSIRFLLCLSSAAYAAQPLVPRAVWQEDRPLVALVAVIGDTLWLHSSDPSQALFARNIYSGACSARVAVTDPVAYWAITRNNPRAVGKAVTGNKLFCVDLVRGALQEEYINPGFVVGLGFDSEDKVLIYEHESGQLRTTGMRDSFAHGPRTSRLGEHSVGPTGRYLCDILRTGATTLYHRSNGVTKNLARFNYPYRIFWSPDGSHCIVCDNEKLQVVRCDTGVVYRQYPLKGIFAAMMSQNNQYLYCAQGAGIVRYDLVHATGDCFCTGAPAAITSFAMNDAATIIVALTKNNLCVYWSAVADPERHNGQLFTQTSNSYFVS